MTVGYIKKITARRCPVHQILLGMANDELADVGYFSKDALLEKARMSAMASAIRWDYIADFIKSDGNCELIPLAPRFWRMSPEDRMMKPEKALAGGHGKKTAGYALVSVENSALAVKVLANKKSMVNGVGEAFRNYQNAVLAKDILISDDPQHQLSGPTRDD